MNHFGTDGIRGTATDFTPDFLAKLIRGLIAYAGDEIKLFLAGDTRESTEWTLQNLATACETFGVEYSTADILPTPAINYCFYHMGFDFAIDVTASHNPATDNGIKVFERGHQSGQKLSPAGREAIEESLASDITYTPTTTTLREDLHTEAVTLYTSHLTEYLSSVDFKGLRVGLDCANGATSVIAPSIFKQLGADVIPINCQSDYNISINDNCGSTHLDSLRVLVADHHLDFGIAYDGDGDRCLLVDHTDTLIDGDHIIAILANYLHLDKIAITVMANQGLLTWAEDNHIATEVTSVGDSNVYEAMQLHHISLGGEQSGHIILPGEPTGDGILTSLMLTKVIIESGKSLHDLASILAKLPQVTTNLTATPEQKSALKSSDQAKQLLLDYSHQLEPLHGRLLVRPSGTEPLIRITMWGDDQNTLDKLASELKDKLISSLT